MQPVLQAPSTLGKRERFHQAVQAFGALCCPNCGQALTRIENDLLCASGHRLNVNRKGCINVLPRQTEGCYDAALFDARQRVLSSGCYQAVADCLESMLPPGPQKLLDAGCGEGWYLNRLLQNSPERAGIGVDISRDAILQATGQPSAAVWCVADLRKLPIADHSLSAVLNILTPASYAEFARILRPDGVLLKVYPAEGYLR